MPIAVTTADLEARWRPLTPAETAVATTLIRSAIVQIYYSRPRAMALVDLGTINPVLAVDAVCEAVQRVLRNPDLLRAQNITGDGGIGITYGLGEDTNKSLPRLRFSGDDLLALDEALAAVAPRSKVNSVKLVL